MGTLSPSDDEDILPERPGPEPEKSKKFCEIFSKIFTAEVSCPKVDESTPFTKWALKSFSDNFSKNFT